MPVTFTGLASPAGYRLLFDGQPVNQAIHGDDYWQTGFDSGTGRWSRTYNIPVSDDKAHTIRFLIEP